MMEEVAVKVVKLSECNQIDGAFCIRKEFA